MTYFNLFKLQKYFKKLHKYFIKLANDFKYTLK